MTQWQDVPVNGRFKKNGHKKAKNKKKNEFG